MLELGAGTGLCGLALSLLGAQHVYLTDLEYALPLATENSARNTTGSVDIRPLDWFDYASFASDSWLDKFDLIVAADVVWRAELVDAFIATVFTVMKKSPHSLTCILYTFRDADVDAKFKACLVDLAAGNYGGPGLHVEALDNSTHHPSFNDESMTVYLLRWP